MYACVKLSADFLRWCAGRRIADPICAAHPLTIRELASTHASRSKGENGAGNTSSAPFARSGYEVLCHKLVDVVVETVLKAVDVIQPTVPACPLPITYPTFSKARHPDTNRPAGRLLFPFALRCRSVAQLQRDVGRLHRLPHHPHQVFTECGEVGIVTQLGGEGF